VVVVDACAVDDWARVVVVGADRAGGVVAVATLVVVEGAANVVEVRVVGSVVGTTTTALPGGTRIPCAGSERTARYRMPSPMNNATRSAVERRTRTAVENG
jgi:hypothetical protein